MNLKKISVRIQLSFPYKREAVCLIVSLFYTVLRGLERVFRSCSVYETMEDYKEGYIMWWANLQLYCWAIL